MPAAMAMLLLCMLALLAAPAGSATKPQAASEKPQAAEAKPQPGTPEQPGSARWRILEPGLELGEFPSTHAAPTAVDPVIRIARIDMKRFALRLLNASAPGEGSARTAREWAVGRGLVAAINASMFQADHRSSVSLMRTPGHVNNPRLSKDKAILAFDPLDDGLPAAQIIDRECQDFDALAPRYGTLVQSIRMVSCSRHNVWAAQPQAWSIAAIGIDQKGRVLFIHARAPHTTHDLIDALLALPIDLKGALYAEGGPEAQLYLRGGGSEMEFVGALDSRGADDGGARLSWPIPNVVGVVPRPGTP
jgi:hypothetical protein